MSFTQKIVLSFIVALVTFLGAFLYIQNKEKELLLLSEMQTVLVATEDMQAYTQLDETLVKRISVPRKFLQPGAIQNYQNAMGKIISTPIQKGEQILGTKILRFGTETGASMKIPSGFRAISIAVNEVSGVSYLIQPDDFIDILVTFDFGDRTQSQKYTYTLFENVQVLAVNKNLGDTVSGLKYKREQSGYFEKMGSQMNLSKTRMTTYTVLVTPEDAQSLVLAQEVGSIAVSLRALWDDDHKINMKPVTPADLTGIKALLKQTRGPSYMELNGGRR